MSLKIKRVLCGVMAASIMFSLCSCTVGKTSGNKDGGVINYDNLKDENGTAVYTFKYTDESGEKKDGEVEIFTDETDKIEMTATGDISSKKFLSGLAESGYQMSADKAKEVASDTKRYKEFRFIEYVQNKSDKVMAYRSVRVKDNGKNNIWIRTSLEADFTIAPGSVTPIYVYGIADMSKYDGETLEEAFKEISVQLEYTLIDSALDDIDWEKADLSTLDIH